jgi:hypothetical protein
MTQVDDPFVIPAVAFRPVRLSIICAFMALVAIGLAAWADAVLFGVFLSFGLALGLGNSLLVRLSVASITSRDNPRKGRMAVNSATRLLVVTAIALVIAFIFRPYGLGVLFGIALFQVLLVLSTVLPVWSKLRKGEATEGQAAMPASVSTDAGAEGGQ